MSDETTTLAFGDRIRQFFNLFALLFRVDLSKLNDLWNVLNAIKSAPDTRTRIDRIFDAAKLAATFSATEVDDQLVSSIDKFASPELRDILAALVDMYLDPQSASIQSSPSEAQAAVVEAAGISWLELLEWAKLIAELLRTFFGGGQRQAEGA